MVLGAAEQLPYLATTYTDILYRHISARKQAQLLLGPAPDRDDVDGQRSAYRSVVRRLHNLFDLMDPSPLPKNRRRTPDQLQEETKPMSEELIGIRYDRLCWFINQIIEVSLQSLPREYRRRWNGDVAIDATPILAYSDYDHCTFKQDAKGRWKVDEVVTHASDPTAGMYVRDIDHRDPAKQGAVPGRKIKKRMYAHEASLVIAGPAGRNDDDGTYPYLFVGMAPLHIPGADPGGNALAALASIRARGYKAGLAAGDRAYTQSLPEKYALPAKALGYGLVLDYKDDQLGIMGEWGGALLIEGAFYCPSIPPMLAMATMDYREKIIDEDEWQTKLKRRDAYRLRPNEIPGLDGHVRMLCPAAGGAPTMRCELKPKSMARKNAGKQRTDLSPLLVTNQPKICRQATVTFPPRAFANLGQDLPYGTPQWHDVYSLLRNAIEGGNGHLKEASGPAIGQAARRRIRGIASQSVFVAFGIFSMNLDRIEAFLKKCVVGDDGVIRTKEKEKARIRRLTESLQTFAPGLPTGDPPDLA